MKLLRATTFVLASLLAACSGNAGRSKTPQDATGDTPIRYVICMAGGTDCFVAARFKDLDGCESHKRWADMLCDSKAQPGKMICTEDNEPVSSAYCTR